MNISNIGTQNYFVSYKLSDASIVNVHLYDIAGQEHYKSLGEKYYKKTDCCLLVYSIADRKSFEECKNYYSKRIEENCKENTKVILLGNKTDLENESQVSSKEGADFAFKKDYMFIGKHLVLKMKMWQMLLKP